MFAAVEVRQVTQRFHKSIALCDCTVMVPKGRLVALVGPNGAGKSTLLHLIAGLLTPTSGSVAVFGQVPTQPTHVIQNNIGFVAQNHALYSGFVIEEMLMLGKKLNRNWDDAFARSRIEHLELPFKKRIGQLSGGQQTQVALIMALAKRPQLLLLDEPMASLDPLARRQFMNVILETITMKNMTVLFSSHIISDLEQICDYLLILSHGRVQLAEPIDAILRTHKRLVGGPHQAGTITDPHTILSRHQTAKETTIIARIEGQIQDPHWVTTTPSLEEIVLTYLAR